MLYPPWQLFCTEMNAISVQSAGEGERPEDGGQQKPVSRESISDPLLH